MFNARQMRFAGHYVAKLFSIEGLAKLAKNPGAVYRHIKTFLFDVNLRETPEKEVLKNVTDAISILRGIADHHRSGQKKRTSFEQWLPVIRNSADSSVLGEMFTSYGSDKSTGHDYHEIYGSVLAAKREQPLNLLEIGLGSNNIDVPSNMGLGGRPGASLRAFRDWAPKANIYGADVDQRILFQEERISTFWVDQTDQNSLRALADQLADKRFDLIIDDGLHLPHANLNTLRVLLPLLAKTGVFVVEDINAYYNLWQLIEAVFSCEYDCYFTPRKGAFAFVVRHRLGSTIPLAT
jgi:hypothetical protein